MTTRRGFLGALLAAAMAPAIVKSSSLMPIYVPKIILPQGLVLWGDGMHDDTVALQALISGGLVFDALGQKLGERNGIIHVPSGDFKVNSTIRLTRDNVKLSNSTVTYTQPVDSMIFIEKGVNGCLISGVNFKNVDFLHKSAVGIQFEKDPSEFSNYNLLPSRKRYTL